MFKLILTILLMKNNKEYDDIKLIHDSDDEVVEIEYIFNKHKTISKNKIKCEREFNHIQIEANRNILQNYENNELIKEKNHFCIDESELYGENAKEEELFKKMKIESDEMDLEKKEEKADDYFEEIQDETIKNNFYCSYSDYFDKIYIKNKSFLGSKKKNSEILFHNEYLNNNDCKRIGHYINKEEKIYSLSCTGCFNQLNDDCYMIEHFNNIYLAFNLENVYLDYNIVLNTEELIYFISNNIKTQDNNLNDLLKSFPIQGKKF